MLRKLEMPFLGVLPASGCIRSIRRLAVSNFEHQNEGDIINHILRITAVKYERNLTYSYVQVYKN